MIAVTTDNVAGQPTSETLGLVRGNSVRARHLGRDITAALRNIGGSEIPEYAELQSQSREQATQRMIAQAEALSADAVVSVRYATSMIAAGTSEILAYGTTVKLGNQGNVSPVPSPVEEADAAGHPWLGSTATS